MHDTEIGNEEKPLKKYLKIKSYGATYSVNANSLFEHLLQVSSNSNSLSINILTWLDKQHLFSTIFSTTVAVIIFDNF